MGMAPPQKPKSIPGVKHVVAVASGKGGVGKSTVAVNLAISLVKSGLKVGIMDADVYGPNVPTMLGVKEPKEIAKDRIIPAENFGLKIMSMGFFIDPDQPVIWRGPMLHGAVRQFLQDVDWGELDYLVIDLPPGTGDVQLSLSQVIPVTGAVIVATPQKVALEDAAKAIGMFRTVGVPLLGVVENMSYMTCTHCDERLDPFGSGGAEKAAAKWKLEFLGALPFEANVRIGGDTAKPVALEDNEIGGAFRKISANIAEATKKQAAKAKQEIKLDNLLVT